MISASDVFPYDWKGEDKEYFNEDYEISDLEKIKRYLEIQLFKINKEIERLKKLSKGDEK